MNQHIIHYILERAAEDKSCIRFMDRRSKYTKYSYPQLWEDMKKYAAYFKAQGVAAGDTITMALPTCSEFLAAFFGAQLIKAIPVSVYPPAGFTASETWTDKTSDMVNSIESKHFLTNSKISFFCHELVNRDNLQLHTIENINKSDFEFKLDIESLNINDICFLQFSSGTTGSPKAVVIDQENALTNAHLIADALPCENERISVACWLPLYHDMGLVGCLLMSIVNGTDLVLIRPDDFIMRPYLWLQAMNDFRLTCTTAPNFAYGLIQKRVDDTTVEALDLSCVRAFLCGAEVVYKETMDKFIKHLEPAKLDPISVLPVYGMAETTLAVTFTDRMKGMKFIKINKEAYQKGEIILDDEGVEIASVGEILPTFDLRVVDSNDEKLSDRKVGRILIKGPCVTKGYFKNTLQTQKLFKEGWLDSGDEGFIFENQLYICGRIKDTMVIRGRNYYPTVYEEKLYVIDGIRKGRAIVSSCRNPEADTEEVVVLAEAASAYYFETEEQKDRIKKEISTLIQKESLPLYKVELYPPGILQKTSSGKLKRRANIEAWKDGDIHQKHAKKILKRALRLFTSYTRSIRKSFFSF